MYNKVRNIYISNRKHLFVLVALLPGLLIACANNNSLIGTLTITEPIGSTRNLEYVEVEIPVDQLPSQDKALFLKSKNGERIKGQILQRKKESSGYTISCLFPINIQAHKKVKYDMIMAEDKVISTDLKVEGEGLELMIENNYYVANLTSKMATVKNEIGAGQLVSLTLKSFGNQMLKRANINMHWAPSFQKKGLDYKTMAHLRKYDSVFIDKGLHQSTIYRSGKVEGYEEIQLKGQYQFYAGLPYFIFSSSIIMEDNVLLTMLRNDEMTMDSLFTHAMFPLPNGEIKKASLYDKPPLSSHYSIKELRKTPINANAKWFCFYNDSLKYGFGSIRIHYDYTNADGAQSPMLNPETRISYARAEGRYWDRRFLFSETDSLIIPKGSRYTEKNAYVIFKINPENPAKEMEELYIKLTQPVLVKYDNYIK